MDYEKKYKESMAKMSTFLAKHDGLTISKYSKMYKELSEIFPELKESEGEKIWIINYLNNRIVNSTIIAEKENLKKAIAWLEKQGEKDMKEALRTEYEKGRADAIAEMQKEQAQEYLEGVDRVQNYEELTKFEKGFDRIADTYAHRKNKDGYNKPWYTKERAAEMLYWAKEELGIEQKSAWSEEDSPYYDDICELLINILHSESRNYNMEAIKKDLDWLKSLKERVQPKQEWSEEDAMQLDAAIHIVANSGHTCTSDWLKHLKDKVQPQPKKEWSEEDEKNLNAALSYIKDEALKAFVKNRTQPKSVWSEEDEEKINEIIDYLDYKGHKTDAEFLKSLRPQSTWKPSEEQITWLYRVTNEVRKDSQMKQVLNGLLCDLKKLREE